MKNSPLVRIVGLTMIAFGLAGCVEDSTAVVGAVPTPAQQACLAAVSNAANNGDVTVLELARFGSRNAGDRGRGAGSGVVELHRLQRRHDRRRPIQRVERLRQVRRREIRVASLSRRPANSNAVGDGMRDREGEYFLSRASARISAPAIEKCLTRCGVSDRRRIDVKLFARTILAASLPIFCTAANS